MSVVSWLLDELAHAGPEHLDAGYVAGYEVKAGVDVQAEIQLLRGHGLGPNSTLVDLGAGTGAVALAAAAVCRQVIAVDVSPAMVRTAAATAAAAGADNLTVVQAGFLSYQHHGRPADVVYTRHALHQLPDFFKALALARIAEMLRPGGILRLRDLVYSFDPAQAADRLDAWLATATTDPTQGWTRAELATHIRTEHSTFTWLLEPMLDRAGFAIIDRDYGPSQTYAAYLCERRR